MKRDLYGTEGALINDILARLHHADVVTQQEHTILRSVGLRSRGLEGILGFYVYYVSYVLIHVFLISLWLNHLLLFHIHSITRLFHFLLQQLIQSILLIFYSLHLLLLRLLEVIIGHTRPV